jgi:superfamily II DNA or RNA helicase
MTKDNTFEPICGLIGEYKNNEITLSGTPDVLATVRKLLTIENKGVISKIKLLKRQKPYNEKHAIKIKLELAQLELETKVEYYGENEDGTLSVPPGFWWLVPNMEGHKEKEKELNLSPVGPKVPRDYQAEAVKTALRYKRGCIVLPTGTGKSMCISLLSRALIERGLRVLIVVPTIELISQMLKDIRQIAPKSCGIGGKHKFKEGVDIAIATVNSGRNYSDIFDAIIIDEAHHSSSNMYKELAIFGSRARNIYGFTATPVRADNLELGFHGIVGPIVFQKDSKWAIDNKFLCPVAITCLTIAGLGRIREMTHQQTAYKMLSTHEKTLHTVLNLVKSGLNKGLKVLVLFKTVEPSAEFCEYASEMGIACEPAHSGYRNPFYLFKDGKKNLLVSNSSLLGEGIDLPDVDFMISVVQNSAEALTRQVIGRGLRYKNGKKLIFIDITTAGYGVWNSDSEKFFDIFKQYAKSRHSVYETITDDIVYKEF